MKKCSYILTFLLLTVSTAFNAFADEAFVIDHYQVNIDVMDNNVYHIKEVIDVDFSKPRHGIYRKIPLKFDQQLIKISDIQIPGSNGSLSTNRDSVTIQIGEEDKLVNGKVKYKINYTFDVGADLLDNMDEFNHNLIGTQWGTVIKRVDFTITLPKPFKPEDVNFTSGNRGSTDNSNVEWQVNGTTITGHTLSPLENYQGLTAALPLPEGYWVNPQRHRQDGWLYFLLFGYPFYLLTLIIVASIWYFKGRDNKLFTSVEFNPPEGMTPSELGYIIDGTVDNLDITSLIIYWADQGALAIEEVEETTLFFKHEYLILAKLKNLDDNAKSYEVKLFDKLFSYGNGDTVSTKDLRYKFHVDVDSAQSELTKNFTDNPEQRIYTKGNTKYQLLTGLLAYLPIVAVITNVLFVLVDKTMIIPLFIASLFGLFIFLPIHYFGSLIIKYKSIPGSKLDIKSILAALVVGGVSTTMFGFMAVQADISIFQYSIALMTSLVACIFTHVMSKRTVNGDKMLSKVLGFREFIMTAEKDKIQMMFDSNPTYYYKILPYAMVLDLSSKWSAHFNDLAVNPPNWYGNNHSNTFNSTTFNDSLSNSFSTMHSSMVSTITSSSISSGGSSGSSSSGGSSGSGSGGGGGGSW